MQQIIQIISFTKMEPPKEMPLVGKIPLMRILIKIPEHALPAWQAYMLRGY